MFDWFQNLALEAEATTKIVIGAVAIIVAAWLCHKARWTLTGIIISVLSIALLIAALNNLNLFANRIETEVRGAPAVAVTYEPVHSSAAAGGTDGPV